MVIVKILSLITLVAVLSVAQLCRADDTTTAILAEINLARTNPHLYAQYIVADADPLSKSDPRAMDEAVRFLEHARPLPALTFSNGLAQSAMVLVQDQSTNGSNGHYGSDRSSPWDRMARFGQKSGYAGENLAYGISGARQIVICLIVDAGERGRGHRKNLFDNKFGVVGVACGSHPHYGVMCVMDFATGFVENGRLSDAKTPEPKKAQAPALVQNTLWHFGS